MKVLKPLFYFFGIFLWIFFGLAMAKPTVKADRILIEKAKRQMTLYQGDTALKTYRISLGRNPVGAKTQQGDSKTPEGKYVIDWRNPKSLYHLSLHISYPNAADVKRASELGVDPGGMIMIHGLPKGLGLTGALSPWVDWTDGCIAVTNEEIEEIWKWVPNGAAVEIVK